MHVDSAVVQYVLGLVSMYFVLSLGNVASYTKMKSAGFFQNRIPMGTKGR